MGLSNVSTTRMVPLQSISILVVDDDDPVRSVIHACLSGAGYQVTSTTGREAVLSLLGTQRFDVVITDVLMPEFDGAEVVAATRRHQPHAAIIAMSGAQFETGNLRQTTAERLGTSTSLMKPFHLEQLLQAIENALAERKCA